MNKHVKDFTIRLNSITTTGALYPVQATVKSNVVSCTPDGRAVSRVYVPKDDPTGGEVFYDSQIEKATKDDEGNLHLVGKDNLTAAKASTLPKNVLNLTVHEEADLDGQVWPSDHKSYIFVPHGDDDANVQWHNLLRELVAKSGKAFVGQAVIKTSSEAFYRIKLWRGYMTIVRQVAPEQINDHEVVDDEGVIKESTFQKAMTAVANMVTPYDPASYRDKSTAAVADLEQAAIAGEVDVEAPVEAAPVEAFDLDAALDGFGAV